MGKNCQNCGIANADDNIFCINCGEKLSPGSTEVKSITEPIAEPYASVPPLPPSEIKSKKKPMIIAVTIIVAILLVTATFFLFFYKENITSKVNTFFETAQKVSGGPAVSLQSLASGNVNSAPASGHGAKYYMYLDGKKIGESKEINDGETTYNGINCYKILGTSNLELTVTNTLIEATVEYASYVNKNDKTPIHMDFTYKYTKPQTIEMPMLIDFDRNAGTITTSISNQNMILNMPKEYWGMISSVNDLYVGFSKDFDCTMTAQGNNINVNYNITVLRQEDVTVLAGTFEDCYLVEFKVTYGSFTMSSSNMNMKIWISQDGVMPKAEITSGIITGSSSSKITQELEGYYQKI